MYILCVRIYKGLIKITQKQNKYKNLFNWVVRFNKVKTDH